MKVAITDYSFPDLNVEEEILQAAGHSIVAWKEKKPASELSAVVADADAVITQFAPVTAEVIASMRKARVIVRYGVGVDNVDLEAAQVRGIPVCNVPGFCIDEVADHTLAFILAATRQVLQNCLHVREGKWGLATPLTELRTLRDQTVGIVGFGRIGREVAVRLASFKSRRLVFDPVVSADVIQAAGCEAVSLDALLAQSDIVTLHCPSTPQTRKLLNADSFARLRPGAIVVNLGRGELIDTPSLVAALQSGHVAAAALDVCDPEPIPLDSPLRSMPNVITASHIASASVKSVRTLRQTAAQIALTALRGETLANIVNGVTWP